ncbi:MAG: HD domain-containing protein [Planctomycetota bacterium]|nr:MAG: HD domain-containing protein [Planctomycetota bacterium]
MPFDALPELVASSAATDGVRIPPDVTVPLTPRVRALIDTPEMRRLTRVSQLGLVSLVYPGAVHSRFEHSLGVYRLAIEFLARLRRDPVFFAVIDQSDAAAFVVAALLHDIGHWAFCHPLEDMGLAELPKHETLSAHVLAHGAPARVLRDDWQLDPDRVAALIGGTATDPAGVLLHSLLSGPIDVDKMDYLARDSLHAGVPYGRHFDQERLLASLCVDGDGCSLAITDKGRTAAELMVFARYVMFSEVYWHHAVRAATAMLQRAVWTVRDRIDPETLTRTDDRAFIAWIGDVTVGTEAAPLVDGLFGDRRLLCKRVASFDAVNHPSIHRALAGKTYAESTSIAALLADRLSSRLGTSVAAVTLLIDAPPAEREVEFKLQVRQGSRTAPGPRWKSLAELSPVVRSLAREQFDDLVKRVRIFAPAPVADAIATLEDGILPDLESAIAASRSSQTTPPAHTT